MTRAIAALFCILTGIWLIIWGVRRSQRRPYIVLRGINHGREYKYTL